jgi:calmodulin
MYDIDDDSIISTKDVLPALRALGYNPNTVIFDKIREIDMESEDDEGRLKYDDFLELVCQQIRYSFSKEDMLEDFKIIDINNDGEITRTELRNYLESLQLSLSDDEIDEIVSKADLNNDGSVDYNEFIFLMTRPDE